MSCACLTTDIPAMVFDCAPVGGERGRGKPRATFRHTHELMLQKLGEGDPKGWLRGMCESAQDRAKWRAMVKGFDFPEPKTTPTKGTRPSLSRACKKGGPC